MRVFLAMMLTMISMVSASAAEWPSADTYRPFLSSCKGHEDYMGGDENWCKQAIAVWDKDYKKAIKGDYQGQRNVSFCLSNGCVAFYHGFIKQNKVLGCAWRMVILKSGHLDADETDTGNFKLYCGPNFLDDAGRIAAEAQASAMLKMLGK